MSEPRAAVMGWGYEGRTVDEMLRAFTAFGVRTVVDVRLNAVSRRRGFSKRALESAVSEAGMTYVHLPALGNPRDNRAAFSQPESSAGTIARDRYVVDVLESDTGKAALEGVAALASQGAVMLVCYEAAESCCHRSLILRALDNRCAVGPLQTQNRGEAASAAFG